MATRGIPNTLAFSPAVFFTALLFTTLHSALAQAPAKQDNLDSLVAKTTSFKSGSPAVTIKDGVQFGVRDQSMTTLAKGTAFRVTEVRGDWVGGYAFVEGKKQLGWLHVSELRHGLPPVPEIPDVADDPQDVEFWKQAGVKMQMDEQGRVQHLEADTAQIQDADMAHVNGLQHLISLDLSGQPIGDEGLKHVSACRGLQKLYLADTNISDAGLPVLQGLLGLEVLAVSNTRVTGEGLKHLEDMPQLRTLNLGRCEIGDEHLRALRLLSYLEILAIPHTKVTDEGLVHLRSLEKLRILNLDQTQVKGPGLENLLGLTELRMLYIRGCDVDSEIIDKLDSEISGLAIYD